MKNMRNTVRLIGNLGNAPEIKEVNSTKVARFSMATTETYRNPKGEKVNNTEWHRVVLWGKLADTAAEYLNKGMEVAIEGKLSTRIWEDKEGCKHSSTEVVASELLLLRSAK